MVMERRNRSTPFVVLVVEDHMDFRDYLTTCIKDFGCRTLDAPNGLEALKILDSVSVDLIISDLEMPQMDGFQLLEHLRRREVHTPFVLLSSRMNIRHLATLADEVLEKPIAYAQVQALIERFRN